VTAITDAAIDADIDKGARPSHLKRMAKVEIYTKFYCSYCASAKQLLKKKGVEFEEYDITLGGAKRDEMQERAPGSRTVPQIFIDGRHIGGCDDLHALDAAGGLDPLLKA
jgi:glutaredoxin 3